MSFKCILTGVLTATVVVHYVILYCFQEKNHFKKGNIKLEKYSVYKVQAARIQGYIM